jgi:hypothetical protein
MGFLAMAYAVHKLKLRVEWEHDMSLCVEYLKRAVHEAAVSGRYRAAA